MQASNGRSIKKFRTSITLPPPQENKNHELSANYMNYEQIICKLRKEYYRASRQYHKLEARRSIREPLLAKHYVSTAAETSNQTIAEQPLSL